ncbi:hypothetical protein O7A70_10035 [Mesorhizobium sp. Cs1299R1N1]|uniref:hypothetical protein n=1 Tax=Mesorhizobium sp. Cs1299R1N1 TaxID=3015172 RepID=UPI00301BD97F
MNIVFFRNAKLEAETLDGRLINLCNLNSPGKSNLSDSMPLERGRLAIVFDVDDPSVNPSIDFDGPGDLSRNSIDAKE